VSGAAAADTQPGQHLVSFTEACQIRSLAVHEKYVGLFPKGIPTHPMPFFGQLERARVLTVGLNPSTTEFEVWRCWPNELSAEGLAQRLHNYFRLKYPQPHPWFAGLHEGLSIIECSYDTGAAHVDVSPWATFGPRHATKCNMLDRYQTLLASEAGFLSDSVEFCSNLKLVIVLIADRERDLAISAVRKHFDGKIETQRRDQFADWVWKNKRDLADLVGSHPIHC